MKRILVIATLLQNVRIYCKPILCSISIALNFICFDDVLLLHIHLVRSFRVCLYLEVHFKMVSIVLNWLLLCYWDMPPYMNTQRGSELYFLACMNSQRSAVLKKGLQWLVMLDGHFCIQVCSASIFHDCLCVIVPLVHSDCSEVERLEEVRKAIVWHPVCTQDEYS